MKETDIDLLSNIIGTASSGLLVYNANTPEASLAATFAAPVVSNTVKGLIKGVFNENATEKECKRLNISVQACNQVFRRNIGSGFKIRSDCQFVRDKKDECRFDEVLEATLNSIKDDTEAKKAEIYGRFLGNIPFKSEYDIISMLNMRKALNDLSFTELCMLKLFDDNRYNGINKIRDYFMSNRIPIICDIYTGLMRMTACGVLVAMPPFDLGDNIGNLSISPFGKMLCDIAELNMIEDEWLEPLRSILLKICNPS